ncbi:MAG: peptidase [Oscillospiraceae bacterium]|nr:peptidase [Oscillospiraceae bacterium]
MKTILKRSAAALLSLVLCLSLLPPAWAAGDTISISSITDFLDFAQSCQSDAYSKGLTVELQTDLDLSGSGFTSIPVFCGTFHGNGHKITHFYHTQRGSQAGLFRRIEAGAVVSDLTVEDAVLAPDGSRSDVGILVGQNRGTLANCTVSGQVEGESRVGGLAGINEAGGVIRGCTNQAEVKASADTGGIVGHNDGLVEHCVNHGPINQDGEASAPSNTGGIAGRSTGTIQFCENDADLGYPHLGYNTGGIVGLQSGAVVSCRNTGSIFGRKDVGGIVGQLEPHVELSFGTDPMEELDAALSNLSGQMQTLSDQLSDAVGDAAQDTQAISDAMDAIRDRTHAAGTEGLEDADAAIQTIYTASQSMGQALDLLLDCTDSFRADAERQLSAMDKSISDLRTAADHLAGDADAGLTDAFDTLESDLSRIQREVDQGIGGNLDALHRDLEQLQNFVKDVARIVSGDGSLSEKLAALREAADAIQSVDIRGHLDGIRTAIGNIASISKSLSSSLNRIYQDTSDDLQEDWDDADAALSALDKATDALRKSASAYGQSASDSLHTVSTQTDLISDTLKAYWDTASDKGQSAADDIDAQLSLIHDQVEKMTSGASSVNQDVHTTTTAILTQLDVARAAIRALTDQPKKTVEDISADHADTGPGRISTCTNTGVIQADANVGGIAGMVSLELGEDPEQDLDLEDEQVLVDTTVLLTATVLGCRNDGDITAKKDSAGGIVGRGEVGAILQCVSRSRVETDDAGQAGGIAGLSRSVIRDCAAQAELKGGDALGGIAGEGRDISGCLAMTVIDSSGEQLGAVAGTADGTVSENYFLQEELGGVDGMSYTGQAEGLSYDAFSALPDLPADFLDFQVAFVSNGTVIRSIPVEYGGSIDPSDIPDVPVWEGRYGTWEDFPQVNLRRSVTVHAVYDNWTTTISSGGTQPLLLAEGSFSPAARLSIADWNCDAALLPSGLKVLDSTSYDITDPDAEVPSQVTLRLRSEDPSARVFLLEDGALTELDATVDGSYLVCSAPSSGSLLLAVKPGPSLPLLIGCGGGVLLLLAGGLLLFRRRRGTPRSTPAAETEQPSAPV